MQSTRSSVPPAITIAFLIAACCPPVAGAAGATFTPVLRPLPGHPGQIAVSDVTGDGLDDVVLGNRFCGRDCELFVLPRTPGGTLGPAVAYPALQAHDLATGDFDGDGRADIVVGDGQYLDFQFQTPGGVLVAGNARGGFQPVTSLASGDLNGDGRVDLAAIAWVPEAPAPMTVDVYRQSATGVFGRSSVAVPDADWCDFCRLEMDDVDGDHLPDLYLVDDHARLQILYQRPDGGFEAQTIGGQELGILLWRVIAANVDDDPEPELVATGYFPNPAPGAPPRFPLFVIDQTAPRVWALRDSTALEESFAHFAFSDLDGDGRDDLVGLTYPILGIPQARIFLRNAQNRFVLSQQFDLPFGNYGEGRPLAITDLNGDSLPDIAIASDNFGLITLMRQTGGSNAPPPDLFPANIPGFGFTVRISTGTSTVSGSLEHSCISETACVSGAVPHRSEVFLRVVGPKGNGKLWPTIVKFTTSRVDVWVHQLATGAVRHYRLEGAAPGKDVLPGLFDRDGFDPVPGSKAAVDAATAAPAAVDAPPLPPGAWLYFEDRGDFRLRSRISTPGTAQPGRKEYGCIPETLCLSGAIPGRSEVFVRLVGPKPNGFIWPTIVKFTTSTVEVWIEQVSTGEMKYYKLDGASPGQDRLDGLFDRTGFQ